MRAVEATIDFSFIEEKLQPYYCEDNGRPSIHPITLFKMMFIGYFYGIRSERQLAKEIETNIAYRWFLGLSLSDKVPHHSTISFNRRTRFLNTTIFKGIFDDLDHGTVDVKYNIITDMFVTAGNVADSEPYWARLQK